MQSEPPSARVYAGLFTVTLATIMHEILLTRIFSVTMWYHFAFVAISVAMFGMTVGAIVVYLRPGAYVSERVTEQLSKNTLFYALSLVVGFLIYIEIPFIGDGSLKSLLLLGVSYVIISVPFVFSGITVALALTKFPRHISSLYAADLLGAAAGCVLLIYVLNSTGGVTAVFVVAAVIALASLLFASGAEVAMVRRLAAGCLLLLIGWSVLHAIQVADNRPIVQIVDSGSRRSDEYQYVRWNSHSRVSVSGNPFVPTNAAGWGLSRKTKASDAQVRQLAMAVDTWAATVITEFDGDTEPLFYLKDDVTNLAHHLRSDADVFVVGVGGGRDVLSALVFDQRSVTGVEINENILRATTEVFGDFAGHLDEHPKVELVVDEARSYITRLDDRFDIIQISLIDTWAATAAGAFVLSENSLYTVEAWKTFLEHLTPRGILTVSRWYYPVRPGEALRIASLARSALGEIGVDRPRDHVVMVKAPRATGLPGELGNGVATILVSPSPFSEADLEALEGQVDRLGFEFIVTPSASEDEKYATILSGDDIDDFYDAQPLDISPPTDDKPFFFQMLRVSDFSDTLTENWLDPNKSNLQAIRVLGVLLLIVTVLTLLCIVVPLVLTTKRGTLKGGAPLLLFFFSIGLGFMFVEISQMQRLMVFLGHPTYALSVVLFTLLVGTGIGSYLTGRLELAGAGRPLFALGSLLLVLALFGLATPAVIDAFSASTTVVRISAAFLVLFGIGLFLGMPFPLGMAAASDRAAGLTPWLWGVNGAASVLCSVLATVVAIAWGISVSFWAGVGCYLCALGAYALVVRRAAL